MEITIIEDQSQPIEVHQTPEPSIVIEFSETNGANGKDGINGIDGKNGVDGINGKDGIDGKDAQFTIGDYKQSLQTTDHLGWLLLDGRAKTRLTANQQTNATNIGVGANIPIIVKQYVGTIPVLTSAMGNANSGGTVTISASSEYSASYAAWLACDMNFTGTEHAVQGAGNTTAGLNFWFKAIFSNAIVPKQVQLTGRIASPNERPVAGVIEASNDGNIWVQLASVGDLYYPTNGIVTVSFPNNTTAYKQVRFRNTGTTITAPYNIGLGLFQIYVEGSVTMNPFMYFGM